ncbi:MULTISPECIES: hypothetical protein [Rhizobium]|uniref:hypothetical protein n=1 Tax=Rhizobium TaxID=379 RepID=UPI000DDDCC36|nr:MULTISPECIES: hypothetical protein [Rhizobium]MQB43385.1 hypothetical protein [Rhizobium sp. ICMP 5592]NTF67693.1 hypothetical protein [Rhizobium rhizogenes]
MPANKYALVTAGRSVTLSNTRIIKFFNFVTDDTLAQVTTAGYFDTCVKDLSVNSIIHAVVDADGTPAYADLRIATIPANGTGVTVVNLSA